jgi:Mg2+-importing ATPase
MKEITKFIVFIGPCSSVFDYTTYILMWFVFKAVDPAHASFFQTGWFVESLLTQDSTSSSDDKVPHQLT